MEMMTGNIKMACLFWALFLSADVGEHGSGLQFP